ncbi:MAG: hypothetical protein ACYCXQ_00905 [Candidatus Humimicrobiaceae bacterium]
MKQYLITEEKLKEILISISKVAVDETDPIIDDAIDAFKLAYKPVEEIAAEEIRKGLINTGMFKLYIQKEATNE